MSTRAVTVRNATFQYWETLLSNRTKRNRAGEMVVHGVRPINLAIDAGWPIRAVLANAGGTRSRWATAVLDRAADGGAELFAVSPELLVELGEKGDDPPELLLVVAIPPDDAGRVTADDDLLAVALDRPSSPGNIGSIIRSVDAFGGHGVFVTGHAVDPYDPRAVRASTGSIFTVPCVRFGGPADGSDRGDGRGRHDGHRGCRSEPTDTDRHGKRDKRDVFGVESKMRCHRQDPDPWTRVIAERCERDDRTALRSGSPAPQVSSRGVRSNAFPAQTDIMELIGDAPDQAELSSGPSAGEEPPDCFRSHIVIDDIRFA